MGDTVWWRVEAEDSLRAQLCQYLPVVAGEPVVLWAGMLN